MRKIMMISDHASPLVPLGSVDSGGQNVYVNQLSRELANQNVYVDVFTRRTSALQPDVVRLSDGVRVIHITAGPVQFVPKERLLKHMRHFTRCCLSVARQQSYDLVHANFFMSGMTASQLQRSIGLPFVITFHALGRVRRLHQVQDDGFPDERFAIEQSIMDQADGIIAECPQDEHDLRDLYAVNPEKIAVIPCGVDVNVFYREEKEACRKTLELPHDSHVILHLGRIVPRKGVDNVIKAIRILCKEAGRKMLLLIVGGEDLEHGGHPSPELNRLVELSEHLGVRDRVRFVGKKTA